MKSLYSLFAAILRDCGIACGTCTRRDLETVRDRIKHEGVSFLTITLPMYAKAFEQSLDSGYIETAAFCGYRTRTGTPLFLRGFLNQVFDLETGALLEHPDINSIRAIRQICLTFAKIELECSDARKRAAFAAYVECEQEVTAFSWNVSREKLRRFRRVSRLLLSSLFTQIDHDVYYGNLIPKHGPGATADSLSGNQKYCNRTWTERLSYSFPPLDYCISSPREWEDLETFDLLEPGSEIPVKVISVPKTLKTPRIIAIEPTCMQYAQQAILASIRENLRQHPHLMRMCNFSDQVPNQELALRGSVDGSLATLDLSEASDRVSNRLVQELLADHPHLDEAVQACRSLRADVPGHGILSLSKFASMGSALTFPMEAFVFLTIVFVGIEQCLGHSLTRKDVKDFQRVVRVYGDDIIVPEDTVSFVLDSLESYGMKVNQHKSFWTGKFRESCGKEYYDGCDVTVAKLRRPIPSVQTADARETISFVAFRNHLYKRGWWDTARYCDRVVNEVLPHYPVVSETSRVIGRHSYLGYEVTRIGGRYQSPLVRGFWASSLIPSSYIDDEAALLKVHLVSSSRGLQPCEDKDHLHRAGRPLAVTLKQGWSSPF